MGDWHERRSHYKRKRFQEPSPENPVLPCSTMRFASELIRGTFVTRLNRFAVLVEVAGGLHTVHVANSGRLRELFQPGREVYVAGNSSTTRKTAHDLALVRLETGPVSVDARLPPVLVREAFQEGRLPGFENYTDCRQEIPFGESRLDLALSGDFPPCVIEVKSVTLVQEGRSLFPDAPTLRGVKHLRSLMHAKEQGLRAVVIFVIQRNDAMPFSPHDAADPMFGAALRAAKEAGVEVAAFGCRVTLEGICLVASVQMVL